MIETLGELTGRRRAPKRAWVVSILESLKLRQSELVPTGETEFLKPVRRPGTRCIA